MTRVTFVILPVCMMAALLLGGCVSNDPRFDTRTVYLGGGTSSGQVDGEEGRPPYDDVSYWEGDGVR
jgi:hypothetical protein